MVFYYRVTGKLNGAPARSDKTALWSERKDDSGPLWPKNHVTKRRGGW
jgi:hypothetical protein